MVVAVRGCRELCIVGVGDEVLGLVPTNPQLLTALGRENVLGPMHYKR